MADRMESIAVRWPGHNRECSQHASRVSRPSDRTIRVRCSELTCVCHDRTKAFDLTVDAGKSSDLLTDIVSLDDLICPP